MDRNRIGALLVFGGAILLWFAPNLLNKLFQRYSLYTHAQSVHTAIETMGGWQKLQQESEGLLNNYPYGMNCTLSRTNLTVSTSSTNLKSISFNTNQNFLPPTVRVLNPLYVAGQEAQLEGQTGHVQCLEITLRLRSRWSSKGLAYHVFPESVSGKYRRTGHRTKEVYKNIYQLD